MAASGHPETNDHVNGKSALHPTPVESACGWHRGLAPGSEIAGQLSSNRRLAHNELAADKEFNAVARKPRSAAPLPKSHKPQYGMGGVRSSPKPDFRTPRYASRQDDLTSASIDIDDTQPDGIQQGLDYAATLQPISRAAINAL